jgi:hypothetical protein
MFRFSFWYVEELVDCDGNCMNPLTCLYTVLGYLVFVSSVSAYLFMLIRPMLDN